MKPDALCTNCPHKLSQHCKGFQHHAWWKDVKQQNGLRPRTSLCRGRHCEAPLCSCMDFEQKEAA